MLYAIQQLKRKKRITILELCFYQGLAYSCQCCQDVQHCHSMNLSPRHLQLLTAITIQKNMLWHEYLPQFIFVCYASSSYLTDGVFQSSREEGIFCSVIPWYETINRDPPSVLSYQILTIPLLHEEYLFIFASQCRLHRMRRSQDQRTRPRLYQ